MTYKVVLWGVGRIYNRLFNILKYFELKNEIEIVALTATNIPMIKYLDGYPVKTLDELEKIDYDLVIILNDIQEKEIFKAATELYGIPQEKLIFYRILELPNFCLDKYLELKKSKISIISNNCWGGVIYHTLGMECLSPFKNLYLEDADYLKLLKNLRYYLSCKLEFKEYGIEIHSRETYPIMCLNDITIHCNHSKTYEEAAFNWERRVKKINWDNIFVEMYTENRFFACEFSKLDCFEKKYVLFHLKQKMKIRCN